MTVTPPPTWAQITGTVTGVKCDGTAVPLAGVTVRIDGWTFGQTLSTAERGRYRLWLDARDGPLTVIAAKDFWQPTMATVNLTAGATTRDFALRLQYPCR